MNNASISPDAIERTQPESFRARTLQASLTVDDLEKSVQWYHEVLRFFVHKKYERDGKVVAASLKAGRVSIVLTQDDFARGRDRAKGVGCSLQFTTAQDVNAIAERLKAAGVQLVTEPTDTPWGARMFRVRDPDGFTLVISSEYED